MEVKVLPASRWKGNEQSLVVFAAENQPSPLGWKGGEAALKRVQAQAREEAFTGKAQQVVALHPEGGEPSRRVYLAGVGKLQEINDEAYRRAAAAASRAAARTANRGLTVMFPERGDAAKVQRIAKAITEGVLLAQYRFGAYKTVADDAAKPLEHLVILNGDANLRDVEEGARVGRIHAQAAQLARDLVNEPPSSLTPLKLAERAARLGGRVKAKVFDAKTVERMGMGALLGVARGSQQPPVFIQLRYTGSKPKAKVALVGKGVTFDSGG
ncbi:MAG: M17 family peptidase N-terminal domain-containing protein, partial [bacterium]